jgi:hypothetical protein
MVSHLRLMHVMAQRVRVMHHRTVHLGNMHQWERHARVMHLNGKACYFNAYVGKS